MRHTATGAAVLIASLLLAATGAAGTAPVDPSFAPGPPLPAGPNPSDATVADFNDDGSPDLAVANDGYRANVRILLNDGSGHFRTAQGSPIKTDGSTSIAAGDFNGDGKTDLAVVPANGVEVMLGDGSGRFSVASSSPVKLPGEGESLTAADLNGDGKADLVAVDFTTHFEIRILLGDGHGGFTVSPTTPPVVVNGDPDEGVSLQLHIADFNGDGKPDIAAAGTARVWMLLNDGSGYFTIAPGSPVTVKTNIYSFVSGDFNGDGKPDVAAQGWTKGTDIPSVFSVLLNDGSGKLRLAHAAYPIDPGVRLIAADVDGDGRSDLVLSAGEDGNGVSVLLAKAGGGFRQAGFAPTLVDSSGPLATADFNGDGKLDILALSWGVPWWPDAGRKDSILFQSPSTPLVAAGRSLPASADSVLSVPGRGGISALAADGAHFAVCASGVPMAWSAPGRRPVSWHGPEFDYGCYGELALGAGRIAWTETSCGNSSCGTDVFVAKISGGRRQTAEGDVENYCGAGPCDLSGEYVAQLMGAGPVLVNDFWSVDCIPPPPEICDPDQYEDCGNCDEGNSTLRDFNQGLELLFPGRGRFLPRLFPVRAVGGGRIVVEPAAKLVVLRANGSRLAAVAADEADPARDVALSATELAVTRTSTLDLYNPATGAKRKSIALGPAAALQLRGVTSKLALVGGPGALVLVRLDDSKLISFPLRSAAAGRLMDAKLTAKGLFYAYNIPGKKGRQSGRVVFEPTAKLLARF